MKDGHLDHETLQHLLSRDLDEAQNRLLLHHLAVCSQCHAVGGYLLDLYREGRIDISFTPVDVDLAQSRRRAPGLWRQLRRHSPSRRWSLVQDLPRFHTWGLAERLCEESLERISDDPEESLSLAELALLVAEKVEEAGEFHEEWARDLMAYVWAHLGNARRVLGELRSSEEAFRRSEDLWEAGSGGCLPYLPMLLRLRATLFFERRRFAEALELLGTAKELYREWGDRHQEAKVMVKEAKALEESGELLAALDLLKEAGTRIEPGREPRLELCIRHNLLGCLTALGRYEEAQTMLPTVRARSQELGNHLDLLRLRWAEARILEGLGSLEEAEGELWGVREGFLEQGIAYDVALVTMELALLLLRQDRAEEVRRLAEEMLLIFRSRDVHREALAALALFQQAVCSERVTPDLAESVVDFLRQARLHPELRFERTLPEPPVEGHRR